jgi:hypothetical protein
MCDRERRTSEEIARENHIDKFFREHDEWYCRDDLRKKYHERLATVRNIKGFGGMSRLMNCLTVQMYNSKDWNDLFGQESLRPELQQYATDCLRYVQDETATVKDTGELEVSLLLEENAIPARPGVHRALFLIYTQPHKQFHDGHIVGIEFGEGSYKHQVIQRIFHVGTRALIEEITQRDMLTFLADDDEMDTLLREYFLEDFNPKYYGINPDRGWHMCCHPDYKDRFDFRPRTISTSSNVCVICMSELSTHAFIPCGHKKMCRTCAINASTVLTLKQKCPICRQKFTNIIQIFED